MKLMEHGQVLTSSAKMPVCKTPVQKTNPNLKHKTKKQHQIKLLRNQFIYVEVAKKHYLKALKCTMILYWLLNP